MVSHPLYVCMATNKLFTPLALGIWGGWNSIPYGVYLIYTGNKNIITLYTSHASNEKQTECFAHQGAFPISLY